MTTVPPSAPLSALARAHERELSVLVVEDDDGDALLVTEILHDALPEARVRRARDLAGAEAMLDDATSCVLLDLGLPDARGTIGVVRLQEHRPGVAIVVLTGGDDEAQGMRAVAAGAQDYLVKGHADERVLARSILYAVERQRAEQSARQLYEAERRRVHNARMTRALLPRPVLRSGGFELSVAYRPGNEGSELGGDFYDAVELDDGSLRVIIGDVSGHGPDEAALGASLRASWRGLVLAGLSMPQALEALDRQLRTERHEPHGFVTACAVEIEANRRCARLHLAGHPPPFVLSDGDPVVPDRPRGPLLGVVDDPHLAGQRDRAAATVVAAPVHRRADRGVRRSRLPGAARRAGDARDRRAPPPGRRSRRGARRRPRGRGRGPPRRPADRRPGRVPRRGRSAMSTADGHVDPTGDPGLDGGSGRPPGGGAAPADTDRAAARPRAGTSGARLRPAAPRGMTLRQRLALLLGISTAVLAVAGAILFSSLSTLGAQRERVVSGLDPAVLAARDLRTAMVDQETGVRGYTLAGEPEFLDPYRRGEAAEAAALAALEPLVGDDTVLRADVAAAREAIAAWRGDYADVAIATVTAGDAQAARDDDLQADGRMRFEEVRAAIDRIEDDVNARRDGAVAALDEAAQRVWTVTICSLFGLVAVGVVIVVALKRSVTDPIIELAGEVRTIAAGDLDRSVHVEGTPELERLGADIDAMRLQILGELERLSDAKAAIEAQARELERSNADLEQFAYVASHDLQEPLRKIAGFCQLLERRYKGQLDERADEYIAFVVDGAQRMQDLINDLLAFSRVGRTTSRFEEVDLARVVDDASTDLQAAIEESGARIEVGPLPTVVGDRRLLVALFQNLIGNAVKFHGDDPPEVRVVAEPTASADGWIVSVADNGIGIDEEYAEQIFTIFQRLHNRTDYEGTGIGLALAKKIVEHHGGAIWLDTDVDGGATFRFTIPLAAALPPEDAAGGGAPAPLVRAGPAARPLDGVLGASAARPTDSADRTVDVPRTAQEANP